MRTVTLSEVVEEYLGESNQDTLHSFPKYLRHAVRALKELEWDVTGVPVYSLCTKDSNGQIDIPTDLVQLIDMGIINDAGEFVSVDKNSAYTPRRKFNDSGTAVNQDTGTRLSIRDNDAVSGLSNSLSVNRHSETTGRVYGQTGKSNIAQYGIDELNSKINISTDATANEFMLIYLSNLNLINGQIMVHEFMVEPLLIGIDWVSKRRLKSTSDGLERSLHNKFAVAKHQLSARMISGTYEILKAVSRYGTASTKG